MWCDGNGRCATYIECNREHVRSLSSRKSRQSRASTDSARIRSRLPPPPPPPPPQQPSPGRDEKHARRASQIETYAAASSPTRSRRAAQQPLGFRDAPTLPACGASAYVIRSRRTRAPASRPRERALSDASNTRAPRGSANLSASRVIDTRGRRFSQRTRRAPARDSVRSARSRHTTVPTTHLNARRRCRASRQQRSASARTRAAAAKRRRQATAVAAVGRRGDTAAVRGVGRRGLRASRVKICVVVLFCVAGVTRLISIRRRRHRRAEHGVRRRRR